MHTQFVGGMHKYGLMMHALNTEKVSAAEAKGRLTGELAGAEKQLVNQKQLQERIVSLEAEVRDGTAENHALEEQLEDLKNSLAELKKAGKKK